RGGERATKIAGAIDALDTADRRAGSAHAEDAHPDAAGEPRDRASNVSEADDEKRAATQTPGQHGVDPAMVLLCRSIGFDALADERAPAEDVFRHPRAEDAGRARHHHVRRQL